MHLHAVLDRFLYRSSGVSFHIGGLSTRVFRLVAGTVDNEIGIGDGHFFVRYIPCEAVCSRSGGSDSAVPCLVGSKCPVMTVAISHIKDLGGTVFVPAFGCHVVNNKLIRGVSGQIYVRITDDFSSNSLNIGNEMVCSPILAIHCSFY